MSKPAQLLRTDYFIGHRHVADARVDERFGLAHFLAPNTDGAGGDLPTGNLGALVALGMRTHAGTRAAHGVVQGGEIGLESIEVQKQGWRIDLVDRHAGRCGRIS